MMKMIDAHIHLDQYEDAEISKIIADLERIQCTNLIAVSSNLASSRENLALAKKYMPVKPAFGFHPEQALPTDFQMTSLFTWMADHKEDMAAIGEIGLPYYLRMESGNDTPFPLVGYIELLEQFLKYAKKWDKPVILHAVYDDAPIICDLLEKYSIHHAHFHWFKGDAATTERMADNGYYISVTPDVCYEQEIQHLVKHYPLEQIMVETDGPWPFEGKFQDQRTHPKMIHSSVSTIAQLKETNLSETYHTLYTNTRQFFNLKT